jgi:hypothetical protein
LTLAKIAAHAAALDPVQIYPILVGSDPSAHAFDSALAEATSGTVFDATSDPSAAGPAFVDAVQAITGRQTTETQLTVASTAVAGLPTQLKAHVTPAPELGEGTVTFTGNGAPVAGCTDVRVTTSGDATCDAVFTTARAVTIQATFSGDDALESSTSSGRNITIAVAQASTMTVTVTDLAGKVITSVNGKSATVTWKVSGGDTSAVAKSGVAAGRTTLNVNLPANQQAHKTVNFQSPSGTFTGVTGSASQIGPSLVGQSYGMWVKPDGTQTLALLQWALGAPTHS